MKIKLWKSSKINLLNAGHKIISLKFGLNLKKTQTMKRHFTLPLLLLALSCTSLFAQKKQAPVTNPSPYKITWSQTFGGSLQDIGFSICEYDTSEILVASYTYSRRWNHHHAGARRCRLVGDEIYPFRHSPFGLVIHVRWKHV